jgi:hypothetical protein
LPDFSWYNIPKRGEIYQMTSKYTRLPKIPNEHKMDMKYTIFLFEVLPFWYANIPSGNPASGDELYAKAF